MVAAILSGDVLTGILVVIALLAFTLLHTLFDMFLGIRKPLMNWMNETQALKSNMSVLWGMLAGWLLPIIFLVSYFFLGPILGAPIFLLIWSAIFLGLSYPLYRYLHGKGAKKLLTL